MPTKLSVDGWTRWAAGMQSHLDPAWVLRTWPWKRNSRAWQPCSSPEENMNRDRRPRTTPREGHLPRQSWQPPLPCEPIVLAKHISMSRAPFGSVLNAHLLVARTCPWANSTPTRNNLTSQLCVPGCRSFVQRTCATRSRISITRAWPSISSVTYMAVPRWLLGC